MGFWDRIFKRQNKDSSKKNSPYLKRQEDPLDIEFAKQFTSQGGRFLFCESPTLTEKNFLLICKENNWKTNHIFSLDIKLSVRFSTTHISKSSGNLTQFKAGLIRCESIISQTGNLLFDEFQLNHFKSTDLPKTLIILAKANQIVRDLSNGMSVLKNKYTEKIPTNITTLSPMNSLTEEKKNLQANTNSKNIYLLLEDEYHYERNND